MIAKGINTFRVQIVKVKLMKCPKCNLKMKSQGTVDETWRFYKCKCGYEAAQHIHNNSASEGGTREA